MLKVPTATFTILDDTDSNHKHIEISLNYSLENKLDAVYTVSELSRFLRNRQIDYKYVIIDEIIDILFSGAYGVNFILPQSTPVYKFRSYRIRLITVNEDSMEDCRNHTNNIKYKLFVNIASKEELNSIYGVSNMYPASLTKDNITFHHDPTRVLGRIDRSAHTTPKKVICSDLVTTVIFEDGSKSQVRCSKDDEPNNDYEKAFMMAWLYQLVGKKTVRDTLEKNQNVFYRDNSWRLYDAIQNAVKVLSNNKNSQSKKVKK